MSEYVPERIRKQVIERDGEMCFACQFLKGREFHHIVPCVLKGETKSGNIVYLCHICHYYVPSGDTPIKSIYLFRDYIKVRGYIGKMFYEIQQSRKDFVSLEEYKKAEKRIRNVESLVTQGGDI